MEDIEKRMNIFEYNRIFIVGNNGSGKSFLAKQLSVITGLPLIHLDAEFWLPNLEMPSEEEYRIYFTRKMDY